MCFDRIAYNGEVLNTSGVMLNCKLPNNAGRNSLLTHFIFLKLGDFISAPLIRGVFFAIFSSGYPQKAPSKTTV
jgi:hypothetical protein